MKQQTYFRLDVPPGNGFKCKVLIVDDNRDLCENLKDLFDSMGYRTLCAFDGHEAILKAKEYRPNFVLMDVEMPLIDGITALKEIKEVAPESRVVMMTGSPDLEVFVEARQCGAVDILTKPIEYAALDELVQSR